MEVATAPPASDAWGAEFEKLRSRFPKAQDRVLFCIHALQQDDDIHLDDLKALASLHGLHVTGASLNAARRLLTGPTRQRRSRRARQVDQRDRRAEPATAWPDARENLHVLFPKTREGILYAMYRLQHDPSLRLPDIRNDAEAAGIKVGGRSLHSARALLAGGPGAGHPVAPVAKREQRTQDVGSMPANGWAATREALAAEFPNTREGILYAIFRLRQDPNLRVPDLRADAEAAGIKFGGRSLHSARALLAGQTNSRSGSVTRSASAARPPSRSVPVDRLLGGKSPEEQIRQLVARIEGDMRKEVDRMRDAIRAAVGILSEALT